MFTSNSHEVKSRVLHLWKISEIKMAYILLQADAPDELTERINELMSKGWVLYGHTFVSHAIDIESGKEDCRVTKYLQAMISGYSKELKA